MQWFVTGITENVPQQNAARLISEYKKGSDRRIVFVSYNDDQNSGRVVYLINRPWVHGQSPWKGN
jgi:hypothetical protein